MDVKDHDGVTALMNAAESGSLTSVEALLKKGADAGAMSATAFTPLIVAAAGGHLDVVKVNEHVSPSEIDLIHHSVSCLQRSFFLSTKTYFELYDSSARPAFSGAHYARHSNCDFGCTVKSVT